MLRSISLLVSLVLAGCQLDALLRPLPTLVWACVEYRSVVLRDADGNVLGTTTWCVREDWTRRVDTLGVAP